MHEARRPLRQATLARGDSTADGTRIHAPASRSAEERRGKVACPLFPAVCQCWSGRVVRVTDGDTVRIRMTVRMSAFV